ncbi:unnamed protein product [Allacma fusca]|uniref:O-acyltransferase WSD1 C-terminal domain-containing protein n=1 Tax=Allacma fusca TaxID=39272 RepID=A0A8J2KC18_9HEXA|nr:unnamed protein product [Allacma fusca]
MLPARNSVFATDEIYKSPKGTLVLRATFAGKLTIHQLKNLIRTKLVNRRMSDGELKYPELQQSVEKFLGFYFYKQDKTFDLNHHVTWIGKPQEVFNSSDGAEIHEILIHRAFQSEKSPWEFVGMNLEGNPAETTIYFRIHHCLADGYSIAQIIISDLGERPMGFIKRVTKNASPDRTRLSILDLWRVPHEQVKQRYFSKDINALHNSGINLSKRYHSLVTDRIELDLVKGIKNNENCSFTAVILACVTASFRKHFLRVGGEIPDCIHTICPLPIPNHGDRLGNEWTFCFVRLPVGATSCLEMLISIQKSLRSVKESSVPKVNWALIPFVGWLTHGLIETFSRNVFSTVITSIFAGTQETVYFEGIPMTGKIFAGGLLHGDQGICVTVCSNLDKFQICLMIDRALMDRAAAKEILEEVHFQMLALYSRTSKKHNQEALK